MGSIRAICWDVDGTLVDTEQLYKETLAAVAVQNGVDVADTAFIDGMGARRAWEWLQQNGGLAIPLEQYLEECDAYFTAHPGKILPRPGAFAAFSHFSALSLPQCAVSSGVEGQVEANLLRAGVADGLVFAVTANNVSRTKPDPEPYLLAKSAMCRFQGWDEATVPNDQFLAIEDSMAGIFAAKRAGLTAIYWSNDPRDTCAVADYNAHSPEDLLRICRELTAPDSPAPPRKPAPPKGFPAP
jgi:beta-phosphoglucomutase-like phosphatase (HAD superfamily)